MPPCPNFGKKNGCITNGGLRQIRPFDVCPTCELLDFPEQFHACYFCGFAMQHGNICWGCIDQFVEWGAILFWYEPIPSDVYNWLKLALYGLVDINEKTISLPNIKYHTGKPIPCGWKYGLTWPGFSCSDAKLRRPDPALLKDKVDVSDMTSENVKEVILRELNKLGIDIYAYPQMSTVTCKNYRQMSTVKSDSVSQMAKSKRRYRET